MKPRLKALKRLVTLYGAVEEMRSVELQRTTSAVREAEQAIGMQRELMRSSYFDGRGALMTGDRMSWEMSEIQRDTAGWRRRRLDQIRAERATLDDAAREQYVASRLKSEQMKRLAEGIAAHVETEERRRSQAASDDRFLARKRWSDVRDQMLREKQMNLS